MSLRPAASSAALPLDSCQICSWIITTACQSAKLQPLDCRVKTAEQGEHHAFPIPPRWWCFLPFYWCHWAALGRSSPARQALHIAEARLDALQAEPLKPTGGLKLEWFCIPKWGQLVTACLDITEETGFQPKLQGKL